MNFSALRNAGAAIQRAPNGAVRTCIVSKIFIDTNILAYAIDRREQKKRKKCASLLKSLEVKNQGVISTQILQELYVVGVKKLGMEPLVVKESLHLLENFEVVVVTPALIREAIDCHLLNKISFWDALVIVSAESARCEKLWTEDLNAGQVIRGVSVENPLVS